MSKLRRYVVEGGAVNVGDRVYNPHAYHDSASWVAVSHIEPADDAGYVVLSTPIFKQTLHKREAIAIMRDV